MKDKETDYLNKLFAPSSDEAGDKASDKADESENYFPLVDVPTGLSVKLYAITESAPGSSHSSKQSTIKSWPKFASVAASLLVAVVVFQVYQQQQTLKQLEQAQADLVTALHYLGEANKITRAQTVNSLSTNMKKAAIAPAIEIGRSAVSQTRESLESTTGIPSRSL